MNNAKKSIVMLISLLLVLSMFLSACTKKDAASATPTAASDTTKQPATAAPAETAAPETTAPTAPPKEAFDLNVWSLNISNGQNDATNKDAKAVAIYDMIQKKMEENFPGIKIHYIDKGWADTKRQNLMLAVMGGNPPDIADGEDFIPEFARIGALTELPAELANELAKGPMTAGMHDGKVYAVSGMTGVFGLVYNKAVLAKAGLDPNTPPKTWDEWLDMSKKITAAGKGKFYGSIVQNMGLGGAFRMAPFMRQLGGDFTNADWSAPTFNSPANLKAMTFLRELSKTAPPGSTSLTDEGAFFNMLNHGQVAFGINGPWHIQWGKDNGCDCGFAPLPVPADGKPANVIVGNVLYYALKQGKHQEASIEFLKIIASKEYQEMISVLTSRMPSNIEAGKNPELITAVPAIKIFNDIVTNEPAGPLPVYPKNSSKVWEAWYKVQDITLTTNKPIDAALADAQKEAEAQYK
jgi:multiple sugar transport system substrate-binding protein